MLVLTNGKSDTSISIIIAHKPVWPSDIVVDGVNYCIKRLSLKKHVSHISTHDFKKIIADIDYNCQSTYIGQ